MAVFYVILALFPQSKPQHGIPLGHQGLPVGLVYQEVVGFGQVVVDVLALEGAGLLAEGQDSAVPRVEDPEALGLLVGADLPGAGGGGFRPATG